MLFIISENTFSLTELFKYGIVFLNNSINSFKNNLDKIWYNEEVKHNWKADLTDSGRKPQFKYIV